MITNHKITRYSDGKREEVEDQLSIEAPLSMSVIYTDGRKESISITMRTPGQDIDLAIGFMYAEELIDADMVDMEKSLLNPENTMESIHISLKRNELLRPFETDRSFSVNSSCGVCGKSSIETLYAENVQVVRRGIQVKSDLVRNLPSKLEDVQAQFNMTGGIHASAAFTSGGELVAYREDVGRHNALDKLIGHLIMKSDVPQDLILLLSGRVSFELIQKAAKYGFSIVCAIGAPSSLAVELAEKYNITLVGFLKKDRYNIYTHPNRIVK